MKHIGLKKMKQNKKTHENIKGPDQGQEVERDTREMAMGVWMNRTEYISTHIQMSQ